MHWWDRFNEELVARARDLHLVPALALVAWSRACPPWRAESARQQVGGGCEQVTFPAGTKGIRCETGAVAQL